MSPTDLVQLYAPLVGLIGLAFWVGALSQRVRTLERDVADLKSDGDDELTVRDRLTVLETKFDIASDDLKSIKRVMEGVQRQLGNILTNGRQNLEFPASDRRP
jgi:hypothetical protein